MTTDYPIKAWIEERRTIHAKVPGETWDNYGTFPFEVYDSTEYEDGNMGRTLACAVDRLAGESITDAHNTLPAALSALEAVLELHKPVASLGFSRVCMICMEFDNPGGSDSASFVPYPCPTVRALEGVIDGE